MSRISTVARIWIKELKSRGIKRFRYGDLPRNLKDKKAHRRAQEGGLIRKVGKATKWASIWEITNYF